MKTSKSRATLAVPVLILVTWTLLPQAVFALGDGTLRHASNVKVVSDKVEDVTSFEAFRESFIKPGMSDRGKGLAIWEAVVKFRHQNPPPKEYLGQAECVHDPIKTFNVYGYGMCCCASSNIEGLARGLGLEARGRALSHHSLPEVYWGGDWHLLDASLICYFHDAGGDVASVDEIIKSVTEWYAGHPGYKGNDKKLREFMRDYGWKKGPAIMADSKFYSRNGWLPAATHGWYSNMGVYDGENTGLYEFGYSMGYRALFKIRPGEMLVRNWYNDGRLHVNMKEGGPPGCMKTKVGEGDLRYAPDYGDIAPGRVGTGVHAYNVPLNDTDWLDDAWAARDVTRGKGIRPSVKGRPGWAVFRMHCPYVYLEALARLQGGIGRGGGSVSLLVSTNNGLDWAEVWQTHAAGPFTEELSLTGRVFRRYDEYLKVVVEGDAQVDSLAMENHIQHSQRALPALGAGRNTITVHAGPATDTITIEPALNPDIGDRNEDLMDFHPVLENVVYKNSGVWCTSYQKPGLVTFPVETPGDIAAVRFGGHFRARDKRDGVGLLLSFDNGASWIKAGEAPGPYAGFCKYVQFTQAPAGKRKVLVRYVLNQKGNTTGIFALRVNVDFWDTPDGRKPRRAEFLPVRVIYSWEENGRKASHQEIVRDFPHTYTVTCSSKPLMKSITVSPAGR